MATDIDSLQIEISSTTKKATDSIELLIKSVEKLSASLSGIDMSRATTQISNLANSFKGLKAGSVTSFAKQINQLGSMDASKIGQMKTAISEFANGIAALNNVSVGEQITQMAQLGNAIARLGNKSATTAIANMPVLASGLKDMMSTLSGAPEVSQNLIDMTNALAAFARTGTSGVKAATSLGDSVKVMGGKFALIPNIMNKFNSAIKKSVSSISNIRNGILSAIGVIGGLSGAISGIKKSIEVTSDLTEVQNVIDVTFAQYKNLIEDMSSTSIKDFGISELAAKETAGRFQAMGVAMGIARGKMAEMSVSLTELSADMASFYNAEQSDVAKSLQSVFTGETEPLRKYGLDLAQATLQEWALKQGLDADVSAMSQAEKTMLRYQYVSANTSAAQGDFARTADTWANQVKILKMQLEQLAGVLGTAFVNVLKPLVTRLNSALSAIIQFAQKVVNALGAIFGWKATISSAKGITEDFESAESATDGLADNLGNASGNAKDLKDNVNKAIRAFDELNVISLPDSSNSGSGSSGSSGSGSGGISGSDEDLFDIVETESLFESSIKNLEELGKYISDALKNAMDSIKWDEVYEKASNFGKGLAQFLNGLFSSDKDGNTVLGSLGTTLAGALNSIVYSVFSFSEEFRWSDFGYALKNGIQSFINTADLATAGYTVGNLAKGLATSIYTAVSDMKTWADLGTKIADGINGFLKSMSEVNPENGKNGWQITADMFNSLADALKTAIATAVSGITWKDIISGIKDFLGELELDTVAVIIGLLTIKKIGMVGLAQGITAWIGTAVSKLLKNVPVSLANVEALANALSLASGSAFTLHEFLTLAFGAVATTIAGIITIVAGAALSVKSFFSMWENGFNWLDEALMLLGIALAALGAVILGAPAMVAGVVAGIVATVATIAIAVHDNWEEICELMSGVGKWFDEHVITPVVDGFKGLWKNVSKFFSNLWEKIKKIWSEVADWFSEHVTEPVVSLFKGLKKRLKQIFQGLWIIITAIWILASDWFNENVITPLREDFTALKEKIAGLFTRLWSGIQEKWSAVSGWFNEHVIAPLKEKFTALKEKIAGLFTRLWSGIQEKWSAVSGWFNEHVIAPLKEKFTALKEKIVTLMKNAWSSVKEKWKGAKDWFSEHVISKLTAAFTTLKTKIENIFTNLWNAVKNGVAGAMNIVISRIESAINSLIGGINRLLSAFNTIVSAAASVANINWKGVDLIQEVKLTRISGYASGGFPEKSSLFIAGEYGVPEMLGTVGGKTAVAGGAEITGIRDEIRSTSNEEIALLQQQNALLQALLEKELSVSKSDIGNAARSYARDYFKRTGRAAYNF